jgi:hypothetical protein
MFASTLRLPRMRTLCALAAAAVAAIPLLLAACENGSPQASPQADDRWRAFNEGAGQYRVLSVDEKEGATEFLLAVREGTAAADFQLRRLELHQPGAGESDWRLIVDWRDASGELLWSYELASTDTPEGIALVERSADDWLRIELSEASGQVSERYRTAGGEVVARQSVQHAKACSGADSGLACAYDAEHREMELAGQRFAELYRPLRSLQFHADGEQLTQLLADSQFRETVRERITFEPQDRSPELATVCRWAERGLLKCRF